MGEIFSTFSSANQTATQPDSMRRHDSPVDENFLKKEFDAFGVLPSRAMELHKQLSNGDNLNQLPFDRVIFCSLGNPHVSGQTPLTFHRQVMAGCAYPALLDQGILPKDVVDRCRNLLGSFSGGSIGTYTDSHGIIEVRQQVAEYIRERDGSDVLTDVADISLSNGATAGIQTVLNCLICDEADGILVSIPQYPVYSSTIALYGGTKIDYYLDEENQWGLPVDELPTIVEEAIDRGVRPRAIIIINPSNPTGACLTRDHIEKIVRIANQHDMVILADEVYQGNVHGDIPFTSVRSVVQAMGESVRQTAVFSFHSCSKGLLGECGLRGGYFDMLNVPKNLRDQINKIKGMRVCPNTAGQIMVSCMVSPPQEGDESYPTFQAECSAISDSLKTRAAFVSTALNDCQGISCQPIAGALYAFPQITLPPAFVEDCAEKNVEPDFQYCMELLENCGICVIPGSGFGQRDGTFHFRTTILPPSDDLELVVEKIASFHQEFCARVS